MILANLIFLAALAVIATERADRTKVALVGAVLVLLTQTIDQEVAVEAIDWNTLGLLVGMMIVISSVVTCSIRLAMTGRSGRFWRIAAAAHRSDSTATRSVRPACSRQSSSPSPPEKRVITGSSAADVARSDTGAILCRGPANRRDPVDRCSTAVRSVLRRRTQQRARGAFDTQGRVQRCLGPERPADLA
jgi:hypothetical protein